MSRVTILMYHALDASRSPISIAPAAFGLQLRWLAEHGYHVSPLGDVVRRLHQGVPLPERTVVLTFDDGFESVFRVAFPLLSRYRFPATVFLVSDYCGQRNDWPGQPAGVPRWPLLSWDQVREMDRHGIDFGAHTRSHPRLDLLQPAALEAEVVDSRRSLEDALGHAVETFAYPYGRCSGPVRDVVGATYTGACGTRPARVGSRSDVLLLERVDGQYWLPWAGLSPSATPFAAYIACRRTLRLAATSVLQRPWV